MVDTGSLFPSTELVYFAIISVIFSACGTPKPKLTPIDQAIPAGISFAGQWISQDTGDDSRRQIREAGQRAAGRIEDALSPTRQQSSRSRNAKDTPSVQVFLETGRNLKITQTVDGLFVSFDRSVVEEYRFREHRTVNVGPIEAERVSGWRNGTYEILTIDEQGALLTDKYVLLEDGEVLERSFSIVYKEEELLSVRQLFDRVH